ncbi:ABC transporter substrate-binding protein [Paenarthrobacter sp. TYUT067]|uniref:ABC transporter substrate-binding protein n=1 Tax=Paenarthrobacter sp. TYUT067 TaxID=2926245 RepID=UPI00202DC9EE|nr:ABC transporter substrate-binding protein [Paenarthrobacter sp. TYUT067]MCM0616899.1 ABC transporter substrate-binding protein [Paenarthrobacter sp. TYUT067]
MNLLTSPARRSAAVLAGALLLGSLTACGGGTAATSTVDKSTLTIATDSDSASFGYDPLRVSDAQRQFFEGLYENLMTLQPDGGVGPGLAKEFSYNADNTVLTLTLKEGVTFTDGSTLDAALVKANLDRRSDAALSAYSAIAKGGAQEVTSVDVVSPTQVAITFAKAQPGFEKNLTSTLGMIVGKNGVADTASLATTPDGSGPYTLDGATTVKGNKYVFTKNDKNQDAAKYPYNKITFSVIMDPQARANALVSGQADVASLTSPTVDFAKSKGVGVSQIGGTVQTMISFDKTGKTAPAFASEKVRQAFQYAINRQALVDALHKGDIPAWNALPKDSAGFTEELNTKYAYDPAKAKSLLEEAGYGSGFEFTIIAGAQTQTDLQAVQKDLAAVGITMNVKLAASTDEAFAAVATTPLGYSPLGWDNPVGLMYGAILNGFTNVQKATDEQLSAATAEVAAAKDDAAKKAALTKLNTRLVESGWMIPLYESLTNQGYNTKKVQQVKFAGSNVYPLLSSYAPTN